LDGAPALSWLLQENVMKRTNLTLLAFALVPTIAAWTGAQYLATLQPSSRLWVTGTSSVRDFTCQAKIVDASAETTSPQTAKDIMAGQKAVLSLGVKIIPKNLDCANNTMNEHMLKALKADKNPLIEFKLTSYEMFGASSKMTGRLNGTLKLGGVEKAISFDAVGNATPAGALHVTGAYPLLMTDYGLKAPSLMMGAMKVNPKVKVNFDLLLK
jgi:polyisoprenoid-binding protein YceI